MGLNQGFQGASRVVYVISVAHDETSLNLEELLCNRCYDGRGDEKHMIFEMFSTQPVHLLAPNAQPIHRRDGTFSPPPFPHSPSLTAGPTSAVTPIYKGDPVDTANYRPVAVGSLIRRLYACIINNRISPYLEAQGLRAQAQAEFRAHRSVNHNLFALQHAIDKSRRNKVPLYCCFIDLTAAFDRVPRSLLWERLRSCGVSGRILAAIYSFRLGTVMLIS